MREANAKEAMRVKAEEEKQLVEFWNGVKECIDKRQIAGYRIPETVIIERNGKQISTTPEDFFNYVYQVDDKGLSRYENDLMKFYLYCDSTLHDGKDWWRPQGYGIGKESGRTVNDGAGIWEKLLLKHRNVIAVFCGHVLKSGVGTLVSIGKEGNKVYQMLANYQRGVEGSRLGGEGYLRIVTFNRKTREIDVKTYSTWNKAYHPSEHHNFKFREVDFDEYLR